MEIFILGAGHHRTPVSVREKLASASLDGELLYRLITTGIITEGLFLSTCNRLEVVGVALDAELARSELTGILAGSSGLDSATMGSYLHFYQGLEAVRYLFRVASGLDSQVLGEPQILGQVKEGYRQALLYRTVGPIVGKLFHKSFQTAKRVRSETALSAGTVSVASAVVDMAGKLWGDLEKARALIVGTGEISALVATHLKARRVGSLVILSRSAQRSVDLAARVGGEVRVMEELALALKDADLIICATGGSKAVLTAEFLKKPAEGRIRPLWIFDLGVPRNVEPEVGLLPGVNLKNIDDLTEVVHSNQETRLREADKAGVIVDEETDKFSHWLSSLATRPTLTALTARAEDARLMELERTLAHNDFSQEQVKALEAMGKALVRRIMHNPLIFTKSCHKHGRADFNLDLVRRIFGLD